MPLKPLAREAANKADQLADKTLSSAETLKSMALDYAPKVLGAIAMYLIGAWVIARLVRLIHRFFLSRGYDPSLETFLLSLSKVGLNILLLVIIAGILGIDTTAFSALLVGAGVAIGSALNGTLGNFAGGVMMLVFKPFHVGDMIEAQGVTGTVLEQGVFSTTLLTADCKTVYVPNGALSTGIISNYTTHGHLRVDMMMAIDGDDDLELARRTAIAAMKAQPGVLPSPEPDVVVLKVSDGKVELAIRPYCKQADYWDVYSACMEGVKQAWSAAGIRKQPVQHISIKKS